MVLACNLLGAKEVLGLMGEKGSEQKCSYPPPNWDLVNKNLFPSLQIFRSCIRMTSGQAPYCMVTFILLSHMRTEPTYLQWLIFTSSICLDACVPVCIFLLTL